MPPPVVGSRRCGRWRALTVGGCTQQQLLVQSEARLALAGQEILMAQLAAQQLAPALPPALPPPPAPEPPPPPRPVSPPPVERRQRWL